MDLLRISRAIGGLLSIITLLSLIAAQTVYENVVLSDQSLGILLLIIGALLGLDTLIEESVIISIRSDDSDNNGD